MEVDFTIPPDALIAALAFVGGCVAGLLLGLVCISGGMMIR